LLVDCTVALGTEFQLTRSKMNVSVDGTGRVKSTLETKLGMAMGSPSVSFSADIDHGKDIMKFGYGLSLGG
jgi:mitochondrial import receptor subunit TOM40